MTGFLEGVGGKYGHGHTQGEHIKTKTEIEVLHVQDKERQRLPTIMVARERQGPDSSL
jgi:hypothetical protein